MGACADGGVWGLLVRVRGFREGGGGSWSFERIMGGAGGVGEMVGGFMGRVVVGWGGGGAGGGGRGVGPGVGGGGGGGGFGLFLGGGAGFWGGVVGGGGQTVRTKGANDR